MKRKAKTYRKAYVSVKDVFNWPGGAGARGAAGGAVSRRGRRAAPGRRTGISPGRAGRGTYVKIKYKIKKSKSKIKSKLNESPV